MFRKRYLWTFLPAALAALLLLMTSSRVAGVSAAGETRSTSAEPSASAALPPPCGPLTIFHRYNFHEPTEIDNRFFPLIPGTQFVFQGVANRGGGLLPHQVTFTVTDLTKEINGVKTLVLWDVDINEGTIAEAELAFFAQDDIGHVWALGEYPEEYENGRLVGAPNTWIAGIDGAVAGVHMPASPQIGMTYHQGRAPDIDFYDCALVVKRGTSICVPIACYNQVMITHEWAPFEPANGMQIKYYAPFVGVVSIGALDDPEGETLVLTEIRHLTGAAMERARIEALKLDKRGYRVSDVYAQTPPAERP